VSSPEDIEELDMLPADEGSWYGAHRLNVSLRTGRVVRLFLKDFGTYRARKPDMSSRRQREHAIYRHLADDLRSDGVEVARFWGAVWQPEERRWWLVLEDVPGTNLRHLDYEYWLGAVESLGRMHRAFEGHGERLAGFSHMHAYDAGYFRRIREAAVAAVRDLAPASGDRLAAAAEGAAPLLEPLARRPLTLVHGAFLPINILVDRDRAPPRVCPLDWELAGVGPGLYDLGFFVDGFRGERLAELWREYRRTAGTHHPEEVEEVRPALDALRLHKLLTMLNGARARGLTRSDAVRLVGKACEIAEYAGAASPQRDQASDEERVST
jgi:hypothetical protein